MSNNVDNIETKEPMFTQADQPTLDMVVSYTALIDSHPTVVTARKIVQGFLDDFIRVQGYTDASYDDTMAVQPEAKGMSDDDVPTDTVRILYKLHGCKSVTRKELHVAWAMWNEYKGSGYAGFNPVFDTSRVGFDIGIARI